MIFERWFVTFCIIFRFLTSATYANGYNCTAEAEIQKNCQSVTTDSYENIDFFPTDEDNFMTNITIVFYVKGNNDAHILLSEERSSVEGRVYEITLGDKNNTRSVIRTELTTSDYGIEKIHNETNIISSSGWRGFWIQVSVDGVISVGKHNVKEPFLSWQDTDPFPVNFYSFSGEDHQDEVFWLHQCANQSEDRLAKYYEEKLKCDLFSKDKSPFSVIFNSTKVKIDIIAHCMDLNPVDGNFKLYGPANMSWTNKALSWEPKQYNDQYSLVSTGKLIRKLPIIKINHGVAIIIQPFHAKTIVFKNGSVFWPTAVIIESKCNQMNSSVWPKESYTCQLDLVSEAFEMEMNITNNQPNMMIPSAWKITQVKQINSTRVHYHVYSLNEVSFLSIELTIERDVSPMEHWACADIESISSKLACQLFAKYDRSIPPQNLLQHEVQVLTFTNFYADLNVQGIFQMIGEVAGIWKDDRLAWKSHENKDLVLLYIENEPGKIWRPEVTLENTAFSTNQLFGSDHGTILYNGMINWTASLNIQAKCNVDVTSWAQNSHICQLNLTINIPEVKILIRNGKNAEIQSPWMIDEIRIVNSTKIADQSLNHLLSIEMQIHRNIDRFQSSLCTSFAENYEEKLKCHLNSKFNLSTPAWDVVFNGPRIALKISYIDLNIKNGILRLDGAVKMKWKDDRLAWDPDKFGGQFSLIIGETKTNPVWKPSFVLTNDDFNDNSFNFGRLVSTPNGDLTWTSPMNIKVGCNMSSKSWPWDSQMCLLHFHINAHDAHFNFSNDYFDTLSSWKISGIDVKKSFNNFTLEITLQTNSISLQIVLCSIFIVINAIVLPSFLISPSKKIKIAAKALSFLLLVVFLVLLECSIPHFTSQAYHFLVGYIILLLIVGISIGPSTYLVRLAETSSSYPSLKMKPMEHQENLNKEDTIKRSLIEGTTQNSTLQFQRDWLKIAIMIERLLFIICTALVLLLTASFII